MSGDFIVGFPGETEKDFAATMDLIRAVNYAAAFSFRYSPRPGTPAAEAENQVPEAEAMDRLYRLQALIAAQQAVFNRATVGKTLPVLIEKQGRRPGQLVGKSPYLQAVHFDGPEALIGAIVDVHIEAVGTNTLSGQYRATAPDSGETIR